MSKASKTRWRERLRQQKRRPHRMYVRSYNPFELAVFTDTDLENAVISSLFSGPGVWTKKEEL